MALLRFPDEKRSLSEAGEITRYLAGMGIDYERWEPSASLPPGASAQEILAA
jgi:cupin superfamily acireductone dioxygenase involved in methionine salvage